MRKVLGYIFYGLVLLSCVGAMVGELWVTGRVDDIVEAVRRKFERIIEVTMEEVVIGAEWSAEVLIVGDVMAHMPQVDAAREGTDTYHFTPHFELIVPLFTEADYVVANLETTLSPRPPYSGYPSFATPDELARDLAAVGIDAVTLANNHIADRGVEGVLGTIAALDNAGIAHLGASVSNPRAGRQEGTMMVDIEGLRVAFVACTDVLNKSPEEELCVPRLDTVALRKTIESVRLRADVVVALVHWGVEYHTQPSRRQVAMAEWMRSAGVDVVVGSHPHVVQPWEVWRNAEGTPTGGVYYSLGNFISNQNDLGTDYGLAARLKLHRQGVGAPVDIELDAVNLRRLRYHNDGRVEYRVVAVGE